MRCFTGLVDRVWRIKWLNKRCNIAICVELLERITACGALVNVDGFICCTRVFYKDYMFQLAWLCRLSSGLKLNSNLAKLLLLTK
jgi:hypothetical protein